MATIQCSRCGNEKDAVKNTAFYVGDVGAALKAHACQDCWGEWVKMQIMIINEYRLDLGVPRNQDLLNEEMARFLNLPSAGVR